MADEIVEKLSRIANDAASKIIEARDKASREMASIDDRVRGVSGKLKEVERQASVLSSLSEKADVMRARLEMLEERLGLDEGSEDRLLGIVGKVVCIKSSPDIHMTAAAVADGGRIVCTWMAGDSYKEESIPFAALQAVEQDAEPSEIGSAIDPILLADIYDLDLSIRSTNSLKAVGIACVGDLIQIGHDDLLKTTPHFGKKGILEVTEALSSRGLKLGMQLTDADIAAIAAAKGGAK